MAKKHYIIKAAVKFVERNSFLITDFSNWYVGVTADPDSRHSGHGRPKIWWDWEASHHEEARDIEKHFLDMGMQGDTGGGKRPKYIYIYKKNGPWAE